MSTATLAGPTAAEIMTANPRTCSVFSSVLEAVMLFRDADCGAVPVIKDGEPVGILTDRDVALALPEHPDLGSCAVSDIMTKGLVTVLPTDPMETVVKAFGNHGGVRRILVVDGNKQINGIIAISDLAPYLTTNQLGKVVSTVIEHG